MIDIKDDVSSRFQLKAEEWNHWTLNNLKSQIAHYVVLADYDYILYLDIDVLVNRRDLESSVAEKWKRGVITVQEDCIPLGNAKLPALEKLGLPGDAEFDRWTKRPICAGVMGFPMTDIGMAAFDEYSKACIEMRFTRSDQAKLTAVLNRGYEGAWEYFGDTAHGRKADPPYRELLVHFTGQRDAVFHAYHRLHYLPCSWAVRLCVLTKLFFQQRRYERTIAQRTKEYWEGTSYS